MQKKTWIILLVALVLVIALALTLILTLGKDDPSKTDSDGDGIPDSLDQEADDSLDGDNEVKLDDILG